jgi:hypothetical protein
MVRTTTLSPEHTWTSPDPRVGRRGGTEVVALYDIAVVAKDTVIGHLGDCRCGSGNPYRRRAPTGFLTPS